MMKTTLQKIYMGLIFLFLYAPIATLMVLSFNASKTRAKWGGFTLKWYQALFRNSDILNALRNTLLIALVASIAATVIGTAACISIMSLKKKSRTIIIGITNILHTGLGILINVLFDFLKVIFQSLLTGLTDWLTTDVIKKSATL